MDEVKQKQIITTTNKKASTPCVTHKYMPAPCLPAPATHARQLSHCHSLRRLGGKKGIQIDSTHATAK